jgi:hypothetical protein
MDAWSRKQRAKAEAKLGEAVAILEELWQEDSKAFANRPLRWQRSEQGADEQLRLYVFDSLIQEISDARESLIRLTGRPDIPPLPATDPDPQPPNPQRRERPLPLLAPLAGIATRSMLEPTRHIKIPEAPGQAEAADGPEPRSARASI